VDMELYVMIRRAGVQWAFLGMVGTTPDYTCMGPYSKAQERPDQVLVTLSRGYSLVISRFGISFQELLRSVPLAGWLGCPLTHQGGLSCACESTLQVFSSVRC
jgi:hypothetical protein